MINIILTKTPGRYGVIPDEITIEISGHADYAEKGKDIVCAGVSALFYAMLKHLEEKRDGYSVSYDIKDNLSKVKVQYYDLTPYAILVTITGFRMMMEEYPDYVNFEIIENIEGV